MSATIPAAEVGQKCVEWYSCIISRDIEEAIKYKQELSELVLDMEPSDKVLAYYSLIDYRYSLMLDEIQVQIDERGLKAIEETDPLLKYLYYFMSGQGEFYRGKYKSAIRLYNKAESLLENVKDQYEKAEFFQRIGEGYYRIYQYTFAVSYLERAIDIFQENESYKVKEFDNRHLLACITSERGRIDEAEDQFKELVSLSANYPQSLSLILQSYAFHQLRQDKQEEAKQLIIKALNTGNHALTRNGMKSQGELAFIHLRTGELNEGITVLEEVERKSDEYQDLEYQLRCKVIRSLYVDFNQDEVNAAIKQLEESELYFDAVEVCQDVSRFFEKKEDYFNALKYMSWALHLRGTQFGAGGDLN